jgi:hypothetical protein
MSGWISVSERLPDNPDDYVVCSWADGHHEGASLEMFEGEVIHWFDDGESRATNPTHWQTLPLKP